MSLDDAKRALGIGAYGPTGPWDIEWLRDNMGEMTGTRDLREANRRMEVVYEYRSRLRANREGET